MAKDTLIEHGKAGDQPRSWAQPSAPDCARRSCRHPAVYHGRALPHCDACDCAGYTRPAGR